MAPSPLVYDARTMKSRHGCLTAWLILMVVANAGVSIIYFFTSSSLRATLPNAPGWLFPVLGVVALVNVGATVALFMWKKIGFWIFCGSALLAVVLNLIGGLGIAASLGGLIGVAILYGVLQIGDTNKGWPQLE